MICRATVFVLFWLHLASYIASPSKFVWKFYLSAAPCCKQTSEWFQKKSRKGGVGLRIYFCENSPGIFHFFTLPLEIPDKTKLNPWIFHKIVLDPLEIPRPKTKTHGNSTLFFLVTLGNSTEIPPLEIPYPQPAVWIFSGISQLIILHLVLFYYLLIIIADQTCYSIGR